MAYLGDTSTPKLWKRMKAYINNRIANLEQGITKELLWENASPTSNFAGQTINLDLSLYDRVEITFKFYTGVASYPPVIVCEKGLTTRLMKLWDPSYAYYRSVIVNDDGVRFTDCLYGKLLQNNATEHTGLIPVTIYGVKGVK